MEEPAGFVKIVAKPGQEEALGTLLKEMASIALRDEGTEIYAVHQVRKEPSTFFLYELFRDRDGLKRHQANAALAKLGANLEAVAATIEVLVGNLVAGDRAGRVLDR
jgi:quinol monooxygenase YgiN